MYTDSQITELIIQNFLNKDKPILSVHDSYIVQEQDTEILLEEMKEATKKVVGKDLKVEQDYLSFGQAQHRVNDFNQDPLIPRSRNSDIYNLIPNPNRTSRYLNTLQKFTNWQSVTNSSKQYKLEHLYN